MKYGFTGTRNGMTSAQKQSFLALFREFPSPIEFHHGACVGADAEAATIIAIHWGLRCEVIAHPGQPASGGKNEHLSSAALMVSGSEWPTKGHFARNRDIVDSAEHLVACPWQAERPAPRTGGGTWMTVEYAERRAKPISIIWPDGKVARMRYPDGVLVTFASAADAADIDRATR